MLSILQDFKHNLIIFLDELIEQFPNEADFVMARIFIKDQIPIDHVIREFIALVVPFKKYITERDERFFLETSLPIFQQTSSGKVDYFKTLWMSNHLDQDDKEIIWQWMDLFVILAEKYKRALSHET